MRSRARSIRVSIHLLDGQTISLDLKNNNSTICDVLPSIPSTTSELEYLAYAMHNERGELIWLDDDKPLTSHFSSTDDDLHIHQHIRFFVSSVLSLQDPSTVELYFLEAVQQLNKGHLDVSNVLFTQLTSLLMQIFTGDYHSSLNVSDVIYAVLPSLDDLFMTYDVISDKFFGELERLYKELTGTPRGLAMVRFMECVEQCPRYGCRFYSTKDSSGNERVIGINMNAVFVFSSIDHFKPLQLFPWQYLENLLFRNDKFCVEVRETKRSTHSTTDIRSVVNSSIQTDDDELAKAVNDPTTQFSSVCRRSISTPSVQVFSFVCESAALCKAIWSSAIAQHQFYLKEVSKARTTNTVNHQELNDRLNRLISKSSLGSSLPSLSSFHSTSSLPSMPSAKVADGSCESPKTIATLNSEKETPSEQKLRDMEIYNRLKSRRQQLEEKLREKMKELLSVCMQEAELTGEIPKEIKMALGPGQDNPKIRKRIGTSFSIPEQLLTSDKKDKLGMLETDVLLHRRIVAAAERLAKDKTTNKSVRKKRLKDYQAAAQKLKGLEMGLNQMRLSASKPDISTKGDDQSSWTALNGSTEHLTRAVAKSCPTTPRGSVPDLYNREEEQEETDGVVRRAPSCSSSYVERDSLVSSSSSSITTFPSELNSSPRARRPPAQPRRMSCTVHDHARNNNNNDNNPMTSSYNTMPTSVSNYENVGYRSKSYRSSYRQAHYPTIQDEVSSSRKRAVSAHAIPHPSTPTESSRMNLPLNQQHQNVYVDDDVTPTLEKPRFPSKLSTSVSCSAGFTASLDRKCNVRTPEVASAPAAEQQRHASNGSGSSNRSPSLQRITTFPVSASNNTNSNSTSALPRFQPPLGRSPLAYFAPTKGVLPIQKVSRINQSVSSSRLPATTDPHMEALLSYYKSEEARKPSRQKTATTV